MLVVAGASLVGMIVDARMITGAPAWLKPFKFAISTAVYSLTCAGSDVPLGAGGLVVLSGDPIVRA